MKKFYILVLLFFPASGLFAQRGFLFVKKNAKTVQTYTTGMPVTLQHKFDYQIQGVLAHIKKDSFSVLQYTIVKKITDKGFVFFDTAYNGFTYYSIDDIKSIPIKKNKSILQTAQGASYLAGFGISVLSLVNGIKFNETGSQILKDVAIKGGGLFALGKVLGLLYKTEFKIGRKFRLVTLPY
jgi:hypothetical protein